MASDQDKATLGGIVITAKKRRHLKAALAMLFDQGYVWRSANTRDPEALGKDRTEIRVDWRNGVIGSGSDGCYRDYPRVERFFEFPKDMARIEEWMDSHPRCQPMNINNYQVEFHPGRMEVGCVTINQKLFDEISERWIPADG